MKITEFIRKELMHHEGKVLEATGWRDFSYEDTDFGKIIPCDSGVLILRMAYKIAVNPNATVNNEILNDFRFNLLIMLFKHGSQIP